MLEADYTRWAYWWEYNKGAYLLRHGELDNDAPQTGSDDFYLGGSRRHGGGRDGLQPTQKDAVERILPELKRAIDATDNRDIATACMIAMAKIGRNHAQFDLVDVFAARLPRGDQEVRETAALAIGIAAIDGTREVGLLTALATDAKAGREACKSSKVDRRTRAFAAYGLGLMAHRTKRLGTRFHAASVLSQLVDDAATDRHVLVAAIHGLSLLALDPTKPGENALLGSALDCLERCFLDRRGPGEQILQAHCPTAIARLIQPDHQRAAHYRELFSTVLRGKERPRRSSHDLSRSCALALGRLCRPMAADSSFADTLLSAYHDHRDQQTRYFSILGLGLIGGADNRTVLLREFDKANKTLERPWCALALGVMEHQRIASSVAKGVTPAADSLISKTLLDAIRVSKNPDLTAALAVALGLCRGDAAADFVREKLVDSINNQELAGYLCIGLALMKDRRSVEILRGIMAQSQRRPELMRQSATALGHLGDRDAAVELHDLLDASDTNLVRLAAIATALGYMGDRRSIAPLLASLSNDELTQLTRAFAAAALGGVADKELVPWNSKIAEGINYRAAIETLTGGGTGILDIL